jgi:hypothetical protein
MNYKADFGAQVNLLSACPERSDGLNAVMA